VSASAPSGGLTIWWQTVEQGGRHSLRTATKPLEAGKGDVGTPSPEEVDCSEELARRRSTLLALPVPSSSAFLAKGDLVHLFGKGEERTKDKVEGEEEGEEADGSGEKGLLLGCEMRLLFEWMFSPPEEPLNASSRLSSAVSSRMGRNGSSS